MAINLDHFRSKLAGDAERLEVNSKGTDLHRKGVSGGGKAVEWIRDAAGLRTGENRAVMRAFVGALRAEYSPAIASEMEGRLAQTIGDGKPLSARMARQIITDADDLQAQHARNAAENRELADNFSHAGPQDRLSGYMASAVTVGEALGVSDEIVGRLFDTGDPAVLALRKEIGDRIMALGGPEPKAVTHDAARNAAEAAIRKFLVQAVNMQTVESVIGARDVNSPFQRSVADLAGTIGVPAMAPMLADPDSDGYKKLVAQSMYGLPDDRPATLAEVERTLSYRMPRMMADEVVKAGLGGSVTGLPDDPGFASMMGARLLDQAPTGSAQLTSLAGMVQREIGRLEQQGDDGATAATDLQRTLLTSYSRIDSSVVKLAILERERDGALADARQGQGDGAYYKAAMLQSDIVALMLDDLGVEKTAQRADALDALALASPLLAKAMADLDGIEREYVASKGGDPDNATLGWKESRDQLARLREEARRIEGGSGSELQAYISAKMRGLTADMLARAVAVLGPPPAPMAVISLGSASRGEASPYSDVEFGIVLDRPADQAMQDYTAALSHMMRFQVANLGENVGEEAPAGFHWDAGGNTPLETPLKFIGTAEQLIAGNLGEIPGRRLATEPDSMFGFTMFSNVELLYGPSGGDAEWAMVQDMQQKVDAHFRQPSSIEPQLSRGQALGRWAVAEGASLAKLREAATADSVDVKALARLPMLLAQGLSLASGVGAEDGIAPNSTVMRLAALAEAGVLSREDADTLIDAFAKLGDIRIQAHLHHGSAVDTVHFDADGADGGFVVPELREVIQSLLPFVDRIEDYVAGRSAKF